MKNNILEIDKYFKENSFNFFVNDSNTRKIRIQRDSTGYKDNLVFEELANITNHLEVHNQNYLIDHMGNIVLS